MCMCATSQLTLGQAAVTGFLLRLLLLQSMQTHYPTLCMHHVIQIIYIC